MKGGGTLNFPLGIDQSGTNLTFIQFKTPFILVSFGHVACIDLKQVQTDPEIQIWILQLKDHRYRVGHSFPFNHLGGL